MQSFRGSTLFLLLLLALPVMCPAQRQPGRGSVNTPPVFSRDATLEIQLVGENSRPVQTQALVEIVGNGAVQMRGYTNTDGRVNFSVKTGTSYRVRVSGTDVEADETSFEVMQGEMFHHEMVQVKPVESAAAQRTESNAGTVSVSQLNVPSKARKEYQKGIEAFKEKKWDKAREHFGKAIKEYPQFDWAYNNMGVAAIQQNDIAAAKENFLKAFQLNDRNPAASRNLGRIYLIRENDPVHAKEMLQKSLAADPNSSETMTLLAYADLQTGDIAGALNNARKVHGNGPQDQFPFAHLIAGRALERKGEKDAAAEQYKAYLKEAENTPQAATAKEGLARLGVK